jgi:phage tail-like protein
MATHESWQFSDVKEIGALTLAVPLLGAQVPLRVEQSAQPVGATPFEDGGVQVVQGDHLRVIVNKLPADVEGYTLTGRVSLRKKPREFCRTPLDSESREVWAEDFSTTLSTEARDEQYELLDHDVQAGRQIWYYTAFYEAEAADGGVYWLFSPVHGLDRGFALRSGESLLGQAAYDYLPRGLRIMDTLQGDETIKRFLDLLGKPLDEIQEKLEFFGARRFSPQAIDAALLPYLDQLLGWPTNFELSENKRRGETENAVNIWKSKGSTNALESALQSLTGWNVEFIEGRNYILTTATAADARDPLNPPDGWDESVDGSWSAALSRAPFNGTPDLSVSRSRLVPNSLNQSYRVMPDFSGDSWQSPLGVLVSLVSAGEPSLLSSIALQKISRMLPYLGVHYADFRLTIGDVYSDSAAFIVSDSSDDTSDNQADEVFSLGIAEAFTNDSNISSFYTYPHPDSAQTANNTTWSEAIGGDASRLFHSAFGL